MMEPKKKFIPVHDLDVYRLARKLSGLAWLVYDRLTFQQRKIWGDQMLTAVDSVGQILRKDMPDFIFQRNQDFTTSLGLPSLKELIIG